LILRGEINDENSRQNPPPHSTDPLPNAAIAIAKDIQAEALIQYNELYDILLLDRSHCPDVQVNTEVLTQTEAVSLITPCEEDLSHPITTSTEEVHMNGSIVTPTNHLSLPTVMPTGVATENGFVDAPELVRMMQHALSLLGSGNQAGAEQVLQSVKDVKSAHAAIEVLMHGIARSVLKVLNIVYTEDTILNILPCKKTVEGGWIEEFACSVLYVCSVRLDEEDGVGAYLSTNKAEEKVKKGMTKVISKWSPSLATPKFLDGQVFICVLDSDQTGNTTHEGAEGIENSLKKLPNHKSLCFNGVMADSGGGFVREPKKAALQAKRFCHSSSLVTNCTCHNIQLTGTVPMKHLFQKGSVGIRSPNALPHLQISVYTKEMIGKRIVRDTE
jgi:hypothetical protein